MLDESKRIGGMMVGDTVHMYSKYSLAADGSQPAAEELNCIQWHGC